MHFMILIFGTKVPALPTLSATKDRYRKSQTLSKMSKPVVSILTPTYNRREFYPSLIEMVRNQTYDLKKCEWIILDDSPESSGDLFAPLAAERTIKVRYIHLNIPRMTIGAKRNMLNDLAEGEYMIAFDDDDAHLPERIAHSITMLNTYKAEMAGNSMLYMYFTDDETVWIYDAPNNGPGHFTNGTAAYRRSYLEGHRYDDMAIQAEEGSFSKRFEKPIVQLNPLKTILVKCHPKNCVDKRFMRMVNPSLRKTALKLRDFIKSPKLREEFKQLGRFNGEPIRVAPSIVKHLEETGALEKLLADGTLNRLSD